MPRGTEHAPRNLFNSLLNQSCRMILKAAQFEAQDLPAPKVVDYLTSSIQYAHNQEPGKVGYSLLNTYGKAIEFHAKNLPVKM